MDELTSNNIFGEKCIGQPWPDHLAVASLEKIAKSGQLQHASSTFGLTYSIASNCLLEESFKDVLAMLLYTMADIESTYRWICRIEESLKDTP